MAEEQRALEDKAAALAQQAPGRVDVICSSLRALFNVRSGQIELSTGGIVSPSEFERLAGKGSAKKWKASVRVLKENGDPGQTIGEWLQANGFEKPRAVTEREPSRKSLSMDAVKRRHIARPPTVTSDAIGRGRVTQVCTAVAVTADILVKSPRKVFICIMIINLFLGDGIPKIENKSTCMHSSFVFAALQVGRIC